MEKISNQFHSKESYLFIFSKIIERISYYGFRSLLLMYMINGNLNIPENDAIKFYGLLISLFVFAQIPGAFLGDLIFGNKKTILIGGVMQAIGVFMLITPNTNVFYIGLIFVVFGNGLYTPNLLSNFGKSYLKSPKLIDASFTLFYFIINIGSFLGAIILIPIKDYFGWNTSFICIGLLMIFSLIPILIIKEHTNIKDFKPNTPLKVKWIVIIAIIVVVSLFWIFYDEFVKIGIQIYQSKEFVISKYSRMISYSNNFFSFLIGLILLFLWTFYYKNSMLKFLIGLIFATLAFAILLILADIPSHLQILFSIVSMLFISIAELLIVPIAYSIITQYTKPKYLAIVFSFFSVSISLFGILFQFVEEKNNNFIDKPLLIISLVLSLISFGIWYLYKYLLSHEN